MADSSREKAIVQLLEERGYISVQELSKCLYVSQPTVRRALTDLEREGIVQRSHGGVTLASNGLAKPMSFRAESMQREKRSIARAAVDMVDNGNVIFLDTSTTARYLINYLRNKRNIAGGVPEETVGGFIRKCKGVRKWTAAKPAAAPWQGNYDHFRL